MSQDHELTHRYVVTKVTDVFVLDPLLRGRYIKTDISVIEVACPYCKAKIGEPCHNMRRNRHYSSNTHTARRSARMYQKYLKRMKVKP